MSRVRFQQIFRFLHLADSAGQVPPEYVTIDKVMIPFKGRLGFKQYMKDKPTKWGIKVFTMSDAANGYIYRLQV